MINGIWITFHSKIGSSSKVKQSEQFHVFLDFWPKMVAKRGPKKWNLFCFLAPGTHQNRICDATSTFHGFPIDFGPHFHWFWCFWDPFWVAFLLVRRFRRFPNTYPLILIRRFPPRGAAVCALRTQWLLASFLKPFFENKSMQKSMLILKPKVMFFDEKSMQKLFDVCIVFSFFSLSKSA